MEHIEMNAQQLDQSIRQDYNSMIGQLGMSRYETIRQLAAAHVTTGDFIRASLDRTFYV